MALQRELRELFPNNGGVGGRFVQSLCEAGLLRASNVLRLRLFATACEGKMGDGKETLEWRWPKDDAPLSGGLLLIALLLCRMEAGSTRLPLGDANLRKVAEDFREQAEKMLKREPSEGTAGTEPVPSLDEVRRIVPKWGTVAKSIATLFADEHSTFDDNERKPFVVENGKSLYASRYLEAENAIADELSKRFATSVLDGKELDATVDALGPNLDSDQKKAVLKCCHRKCALVVGGPGTGKTTVVATVLRLLLKIDPELNPEEIALVAPTGRAAARLHESLHQKLEGVDIANDEGSKKLEGLRSLSGKTIHKLLKFVPFKDDFTYGKGHPLPYKVVVVDESSMVDVFLFQRLLEALPEDCRLYLFGDEHQLPSVDAGAVLGALSGNLGEENVAKLKTNHRSVKCIAEFAEAVNDFADDKDKTLDGILKNAAALEIKDVDENGKDAGRIAFVRPFDSEPSANRNERKKADDAALDEFVGKWSALFYEGKYAENLNAWEDAYNASAMPLKISKDAEDLYARSKTLYESIDRARVLSLVRKGARGVESLNDRFARKFGKNNGKPVMIMRNDYSLDLSNGDVGMLLDIKNRGPALLVKRGDGSFELIDENRLPPFEDAFAITVHKSQGSEYDNVALILPEEDHRLMSREIVYTAITRAKSQVFLLGSANQIREAASRPIERDSGIAEKLGR